jgi:hypothetical protein
MNYTQYSPSSGANITSATQRDSTLLRNPKDHDWVTLDCDRGDYDKDYDSQGCDVMDHNLNILATDITADNTP